MKTLKYLEILRRKYEEAEPPIRVKLYGWNEIVGKLEERQRPVFGPRFRFAFLTIAVLVLGLFSLGLFKVAQASMPGSPFYPIKRLSETLVNKANGNNQASIDNRAAEIVTLAKQREKDSQKLESVVVEYKRAVKESQKRTPEFEKRLEEHNREFNKVVHESPEVEHEIKDAIEASETHHED